jgi:DNA polymerase-1
MPVQGTEADLMKMAMIALEDKLSEIKGAFQILQIHDSILVECLEADVDRVGECMQEVMENIAPDIGIRLKVDIHSGKNWGEL